MRAVGGWLKSGARDFFTLDTLRKRIPIIEWLPKYKLDLLLQDIIAGISVGLTAIPQGIAYAEVANLNIEYGLYSGFMGCFVYLFFGSCKDLTIGPTAILALMTQKYVEFGSDFAVLLTFLSGCIVFLMGIFHLGFLIEFISMPVTIGFTTAAAITIGFTQLHSLLGFSGKSDTFLDVCINLIKNGHTVRLWDSILGISTIIILLLLRELRRWGSRTSATGTSLCKSIFSKIIWLISLGRNAIVVILGCVTVWLFKQHGMEPFRLIGGNVTQGLPPFEPPPFTTVLNNETLSFVDMVEKLNISVITISLISILESIAIAKAFAGGKIVDATQEMLALGACNIMGSFVRSMPTTGSFTRTVVNNASGVQTTFGGIFTGALVLMALSFLTPVLYFIPKAVLAGLIISAMIFMVDFEIVGLLWRSKKIELLPFFSTLLCCLFIGLEIGIVVGIIINILLILAHAARPEINAEIIKIQNQDVMVIAPTDSLMYCSADHLSRSVLMLTYSKKYTNNTTFMVIIDGSRIKRIDVTVAKNLKVMIENFKKRNQKVFLWLFAPAVQNVLSAIYSDANLMYIEQTSLEEIIKYAGSTDQGVFEEIILASG